VRVRRLVIGAAISMLTCFAATLAGAAPASAHPFGNPQTATVAVDGGNPRIVRVTWKPGALDDLALLRDFLDLPGRRSSYRDGLPNLSESAEAARQLTRAPALTRYLLGRVAVTSGGACAGRALPIDSLAGDGVTLEFTCSAPVTTASVELRTLTDLHPAYRTLATGPGGQRAVYDSDHETHDWAVTAAAAADSGVVASTGRSAALQLSAMGGVLAAVVGAVLVVRRRRTRKEQPA
jgi:hypothetical protein